MLDDRTARAYNLEERTNFGAPASNFEAVIDDTVIDDTVIDDDGDSDFDDFLDSDADAEE